FARARTRPCHPCPGCLIRRRLPSSFAACCRCRPGNRRRPPRRFQKGKPMSEERRITVWVQRFKDRSTLVLQWIDPDTGKRKSKSAGTSDHDIAEGRRKDLEYELTHGKYQEASRMTWERFRELFEAEHLPS